MFTDQKSLITWLKKQESSKFSKLSDYFDEEQIEKLLVIYNDSLNLSDHTLGLVIKKIGAAIADLVQLAATVDTLTTGAEKKAFVLETVAKLYHLIDTGIHGYEDNIDKDVVAAAGYPTIKTEADLQEMFVAMADQSIEALWGH